MPQITGKNVGPIGFGMMMLVAPGTSTTQDQAFEAMREALRQGSNFWNGGEFYGTPERNSLHLLNEYFTKYPEDADKVVLSIKGGMKPGSYDIDGSEEGVKRTVEDSLKVLDGKKFIDLFEIARIDPEVPIEQTISYLAKYVAAGKIGGIGLSEASASTIRRAASIHPIAAYEAELSLWSTQTMENGTLQTCGELDIPFVAYSPLGKGFLTGQLKTYEDLERANPHLKHFPRFQPGVFEENLKLVDEINEVAKSKDCTPAQVAIAWVVAQGDKTGNAEVIALPGSSSAKRVAENCSKVSLTKDEMKTIDEILQRFEVKGDRYPETLLKQVEK